MIDLKFKQWFVTETGTSTGDVATFAQPVGGLIKRGFDKKGKVNLVLKSQKKD